MPVKKRHLNKASILIPVLIVFFIIAMVSLSIIQQVVTGLAVSSDSAKSHVAYQESDQRVELFLNQMKVFDENSCAFDLSCWSNSIPENTPLYLNSTSGICRGGWFFDSGEFAGLKCYAQRTGIGETAPREVTSSNQPEAGNPYKLSELVEISIPAQSSGTTRAIRAPLPVRTVNVFDSGAFMDSAPQNLFIKRCTIANGGDLNACQSGSGGYNNDRYVILQWKHIEGSDLTLANRMTEFKGMEFRYFRRNSAYPGDPADLLVQNTWYPAAKFKLNDAGTEIEEDCTPPSCKCLSFDTDWNSGGYDACIIELTSNPSYYHWFTVKTRNKTNFKLDSLYRTPIAL